MKIISHNFSQNIDFPLGLMVGDPVVWKVSLLRSRFSGLSYKCVCVSFSFF
jgi:hypothetical protein